MWKRSILTLVETFTALDFGYQVLIKQFVEIIEDNLSIPVTFNSVLCMFIERYNNNVYEVQL